MALRSAAMFAALFFGGAGFVAACSSAKFDTLPQPPPPGTGTGVPTDGVDGKNGGPDNSADGNNAGNPNLIGGSGNGATGNGGGIGSGDGNGGNIGGNGSGSPGLGGSDAGNTGIGPNGATGVTGGLLSASGSTSTAPGISTDSGTQTATECTSQTCPPGYFAPDQGIWDHTPPGDITCVASDSWQIKHGLGYALSPPPSCTLTLMGYRDDLGDGCFDPQTMIRLADGSERLITELKAGDLVWEPRLKAPARIVRMIQGPEALPMIEVSLGGAATILVTRNHPMLTERGVIPAFDLTATDRIPGADGVYRPIASVKSLPPRPGQMVYNLEVAPLDGPKIGDLAVVANGVTTGDLGAQLRIGKERTLLSGVREVKETVRVGLAKVIPAEWVMPLFQ
jgi:hypothetical protein